MNGAGKKNLPQAKAVSRGSVALAQGCMSFNCTGNTSTLPQFTVKQEDEFSWFYLKEVNMKNCPTFASRKVSLYFPKEIYFYSPSQTFIYLLITY